jgi:hypothetical protein
MDDARSWIADLDWQNVEREDLMDMSDATIRKAIDKYYDGGWEQFIHDGQYSEGLPVAEPHARALHGQVRPHAT